jgi:hypothetical protein
MAPRERIKKPEPERTQPIRNWTTLFGPSAPTSPPSSAGPAEQQTRATDPSDPISRGVGAGYRVIEEYMRQGQNAARVMWAPFGPAAGNSPSADEVQQRMGMMFRQATDLARMWLDVVGTGFLAPPFSRAPGASPGSVSVGPFPTNQPSAGAPPPGRPDPPQPPPPQGSDQTALTIEMESTRRTDVSIHLRPQSSGLPLRMQDLRAPDPQAPRLTEVTIEGFPEEDRVVFRIRVPDDQPPGVYSGIILDERTSLPRGTLSVRIAPPSSQAS